MTSTSLVSVLAAYPEKSPFDWEPIIHNVVPRDRDRDVRLDTPEFTAAALAQARKTGMNPLWMWYGTNPLTVFDPDLQEAEFPITAYTSPPPLPKADLSGRISFIEQLNVEGNTPVFKVRVGDDLRILKVFPDMDREEEVDPDPEAWGLSMVRFRREKEAYAHLVHFGACEKGAVPMCYGWAELPRPLVMELSGRFGDRKSFDAPLLVVLLAKMKYHKRLPKVLLLEYVSNAVPLSVLNITAEVARAALRALVDIHHCYVKHNDVNRRNILVIPGEKRVVWIDFDVARCFSPEKPTRLRRQDFLFELAKGWSFFYADLLPDKRIGLRHWLY